MYNQYRNQGEKKRFHLENQHHSKRSDEKNNKKQDNRLQDQHQQLEMKCPRCSRNHLLKDCWVELGVCFTCKQKGHLAANCPEKNQQRNTQGRVFALASVNEETSDVNVNQEPDM